MLCDDEYNDPIEFYEDSWGYFDKNLNWNGGFKTAQEAREVYERNSK